MFCGQCGLHVDPEDQFCRHCGVQRRVRPSEQPQPVVSRANGEMAPGGNGVAERQTVGTGGNPRVATQAAIEGGSECLEGARWWERLAAAAIDVATLVVVAFAAESVLYHVGYTASGIGDAVFWWVFCIGFVLYPLLCWFTGHSTLGELGLAVKPLGPAGEPLNEVPFFRRLVSIFGAYFGVGYCQVGRRWTGHGAVYLAGVVVVMVGGCAAYTTLPRQGEGAGWGVHVCAHVDLDVQDAICHRETPVLAMDQLSTAVLNVTGKDGADFSSTALTVIVSTVNSDGAMQEAGRTTASSDLASDTEYWPLPSVLGAAGVTAKAGTAYSIEVDGGTGGNETLLGTASFSVQH